MKALSEFFRRIQADLGLAYVVVVHLAPDHPSILSEILQECTTMSVLQVNEPRTLTPECVYVIPPDRELVIDGNEITARPFSEPRGRRAPIDMFFRSIAHARGDGMAVILSGGGSDGAIGVRAVKEASGVIFVQDPTEADYAMMPHSAIATGSADFIAPVSQLTERIAEVARSKEAVRSLAGDGAASDLRRIINFLRARTGHDFSSYKRATVIRRVLRRLQVTRKESLAVYGEYVRDNPEEAQLLFQDLLISVTMFFRDPKAFETFATRAIAPMFDQVSADDGIRAWVVGCATGEEAYSLAILLLEESRRREIPVPIQIFATDLDEGALATARDGRYPRSIEADVSDERLNRYFIREGNHYRVREEVRDLVVFATHSVLKDPPFLRINLITCRNLLIYLERELQRQLYTMFHYGLNDGGYLFLGSAETIDATPDLFTTVDREWRLYRSRPDAARHMPHIRNVPYEPYRFVGRDPIECVAAWRGAEVADGHHRAGEGACGQERIDRDRQDRDAPHRADRGRNVKSEMAGDDHVGIAGRRVHAPQHLAEAGLQLGEHRARLGKDCRSPAGNDLSHILRIDHRARLERHRDRRHAHLFDPFRLIRRRRQLHHVTAFLEGHRECQKRLDISA